MAYPPPHGAGPYAHGAMHAVPPPVRFSASSLQPILQMVSFLPTFIGVALLATQEDNKEYKDKEGITGGVAGALCVGYGLALAAAVSSRQTEVCNILALARAGLALMSTLSACTIGFIGGSDCLGFIVLYTMFAVLALPEVWLLFVFVQSLHNAREPTWAPSAMGPPPMASGPPPAYGGAAPNYVVSPGFRVSSVGYNVAVAGPPPSSGPGYDGYPLPPPSATPGLGGDFGLPPAGQQQPQWGAAPPQPYY
eukprot:gnl/TRDRNA2_/TRDRNA2_43806_c0_seq2.p1 gnl/TRDRNA2_/TRDRNA2_43806_c0~~gnl/TRDRNA2_/TRDRNA2_43806_c0_seq2.p1  ORF type:complete len:251 (-),score=32.94 gnl/TRDRNA2_/TRDRNA2_43806_c0_seq2:10-762(-)